MIRDTEFFDQIEDYCQEQLEQEIKLEFEAELKRNPKLKTEVELWMEIQSAIEEREVLTLRRKLEEVANQCKTTCSSIESFEFLGEFYDIEELNQTLSSEQLINFYDSLPKVHAYHHESKSDENIHQFYRYQNELEGFDIEDDLTDFEFEEFEGLEEAILEKDILHFRQTLKQVAKSVKPQFSVEEIDDFLNGELTGVELLDFENDMFQNRSLRDEINLHQNIELATNENDVMNLRSQISDILRTESSWNVTEKSIEDFIDGILEGELLDEFELELHDNTDLIAEVKLRKQINESIKENDIFNLRNELNAARESAQVKKLKMIVPDSKTEHIKFWRSSVAILIVLLGIAGVLRNSFVSVDNTYDNYFNVPSWSPERSIASEISLMQQANILYLNADYAEVIKVLDQSPVADVENPVFNFYKAASLQALNNYSDAISLYSKVIEQGDNLFLEEAKWYRSLCYLKQEEYEKSKTELLAIIERKGHFENDAKAIIRRLKYSFK